MASSNLLYQDKVNDKAKAVEIKGNSIVSIYPNPVTTRSFDIQFGTIAKGNYVITLSDAAGNPVVTRTLNLISGQTEKINLPVSITQGMYMITIVSKDANTILYNDKIIIGR